MKNPHGFIHVLRFLKGKSLKSFVNHCIFLSTSSMDNNPHFLSFSMVFLPIIHGFDSPWLPFFDLKHWCLRIDLHSVLMGGESPAMNEPLFIGNIWEYYGNIWEYMEIFPWFMMVYDGLWWFMEYHENLNHHRPSFFPWFWQFCPANTSDKAFF